MSTYSIHCEGKRYTVRVTPMQKLSALVEQTVSQLKTAPDLADCLLLANGKPLDTSVPVRFANLPTTAKLELKTGKASKLGLSAQQMAAQRNVSEAGPSISNIRPVEPSFDSSAPPRSKDASNIMRQGQNPDPSSSFQLPTPQNATQHAEPSHPAGTVQQDLNVQSSVPSPNHASHPPGSHTSLSSQNQRSADLGSTQPQLRSSVFVQQSVAAANAGASHSNGPNTGREDSSSQQNIVPEHFLKLGLDRAVLVYTKAALEALHPGTSAEELPEEFYDFGVEDYARVMQGLQRSKREAEKGLRTSKLREQEDAEKASRFPTTTVRVIFADGYILQMQFSSMDTVASLKASVRKTLLPEVAKSRWYLYTSPPKEELRNEKATLYQARLCPAAQIYFGSAERGEHYLRKEIEALETSHVSLPEVHKPQEQLVKSGGSNVAKPAGPYVQKPEFKQSSVEARDEKRLPKWMKLQK